MNSFLCHGESQIVRDHVNFDRVCFELAKMIDSTNASFVFLPFGNGLPFNDCIANGILYSRCKMKNHCLAKAIADCGWYEYKRQLRYVVLRRRYNSAYKEEVRTVAAASKEQLARRIISI